MFGADAYAPQEIATRVLEVGVAKARLPWLTQAMLGVLAGAFIGFGALMFTLVASDASLGFAATRLLGGWPSIGSVDDAVRLGTDVACPLLAVQGLGGAR